MLTSIALTATSKEFSPPNDGARTNLLVDSTLGVDPEQGATGGPRALTWQCAYFDGAIHVRNDNIQVWQTARTIADITELSITFDNRPWMVVSYVQSGTAYVSWLNDAVVWVDVALGAGAVGPMVAQYGAANCPDSQVGAAAVYLRGGYVCARDSKDNYSVEYQLAVAPASATRVQRAGMSTTDEFLIELDGSVNAVTAVAQDILTDTYYCAVGDQTIPLFRGDRITGTWRSKVIQRDHYITFAWLRLDGPFESAYVRIYESGALKYSTPAITSNTPVRLPPGRYHETEIEVESDGVVTAIVLADSAQELWAA